MRAHSSGLDLKKAVVPAFLTGVSFIAFAAVYYLLTRRVVEPYYLEGLLFALPFIVFGIITYFTAKDKVNESVSRIVSVTLAIIFSVLALCLFAYIVLDSAAATTTDVRRYEKALSHMPERLTVGFPSEIPDNAEDILFSYHPALGQGGEELSLKFKTDEKSIQSYKARFSNIAVWQGKHTDRDKQNYGIHDGMLDAFGSSGERPGDLEIYVLYSRPYRPGSWNHGKLSMVAISQANLEILFYAEEW